MAHPDPAVRRDGLKKFDILCEVTARLRIPVITLCTGTRDPGQHVEMASRQRLQKSIESALIAAEKNNLILAFEPESGERRQFGNPCTGTTAALLQAIAADEPGVSEEDLRNLEIPTLIIGYDIDYIHPLSYAAAISQLIPRSQLVSVTPKAVSKATYFKDFHTAITNFLETFP